MAEITGGELLVKCLANEGIKFVFGLPCPEVDPMLAKLEQNDIRFVPVRHEAAGVHMAEGLYKTTGQVSAVLGNPGPGSANLVPGVITAVHEGVPVLVITAQHRLDIVYPSPPSTFQGQDQLDLFKVVTKWNAPVLAWARLPEVVRMAFRQMWIGRPGPVHIEVPAPIMYAAGDEAKARMVTPSRYRPSGPFASQEQIDEAGTIIAAAKRPIVLSGAGVDRAGANAELMELVELLDCPVIATMAGRASVPGDHPNALYAYSTAADAARREADVIIACASRVGNLDIPYDKYWGDPSAQKLIQIDVDARCMGVTRLLTLGILSDVKFALAALVRTLKTRAADFSRKTESTARYRDAMREWREKKFEPIAKWRGPGIHPAHALEVIGRVFGSDSIYVTDGGNTSLWSHWFLPYTRPRSYLNILELGMLGTGVPSAIGAKLGNPGREVVCISGDGAAGFNFMEMQSAARENLKLVTIVFAEGSWTMEEPNERRLFGRTFGTAMGVVRWDQVGQGLGCDGFVVNRLEDLEETLKRARDSSRPAVVCLQTDRDANLAVPGELMMRFAEVYQGPMGQ